MKNLAFLVRRWLVVFAVVAFSLVGFGAAQAGPWGGAAQTVSITRLPPEALDTLRLIIKGGPFPHRQDGRVFGNREKRLPLQPHGYYTEYTVRTPGAQNRGARRIVAGQGETGDPATSGEYWYTGDHYRTFRRIVK